MLIFDDVIGPIVTAKHIAEERDENAKQLMIALGNKQPASAKEIAELVDKTMPKDPVALWWLDATLLPNCKLHALVFGPGLFFGVIHRKQN